MPHCKITNWTTIRNMCRRRFAAQAAEEVQVQAVELARQHAKEVAAFDREGEVAQKAMDRVMEEASVVAADVGKMHAHRGQEGGGGQGVHQGRRAREARRVVAREAEAEA
jgi:hypothetical protein